MTLDDWAKQRGYTDKQIAELMCDWLKSNRPEGGNASVSVSAVQKYRTGRVPIDASKMRAIYEITKGQVQANDFYLLPSPDDV